MWRSEIVCCSHQKYKSLLFQALGFLYSCGKAGYDTYLATAGCLLRTLARVTCPWEHVIDTKTNIECRNLLRAYMSQRSNTCACHQNKTENNTDETKKLNHQIATGVQIYAWPWCQSNTQKKPRSVQTVQIELNPQTATVVERYAWPCPTLHTIQVRLRVGDHFGFNVFIW